MTTYLVVHGPGSDAPGGLLAPGLPLLEAAGDVVKLELTSLDDESRVKAFDDVLPRADALARVVKRSVTNTTEGMPFFNSFTLSWTLHAVQDPQFARPTMASWARSPTSSKVS